MTHKFSKYLIFAVTVLGLSALPALANTPPACGTGQFGTGGGDDYDSTFSCTIGNLTFSDFVYSTSTGVTGTNVNVDPVTGPDGPGFNFKGAWEATAGQDLDVDVTFDVTAAPGTSIDDIYIILGASAVTPPGSTANASYEETYCTSGPNEPCYVQVEQPGAAQTDVITLNSPQTSLSIDKDLELFGGNGTVSVSSFGNQYSTVPEPRAISLLLGLGLVAGFAIFKRRQVAQS